jgi:peptidoglycan hydrolase-like protein with peptidoglycan-binding domain
MLVLAVVLGIAPSQSPESADIASADSPVVSTRESPVQWLNLSLAQVDGALLYIRDDRAGRIGRVLVDPATAPVAIAPGDEGAVVVRLQERLRDLGVYRGITDGVYGRETAASVVAFHKVIGVERSNEWTVEDWDLTEPPDHREVLARNPDEDDRVEVDLGRQVMFVIRGNKVTAVIPVSTGNGERYWSLNGGANGGYVRATTPRGDFTLFRHISGWRVNYLGGLYKPWYFTPYYAIHGSRSVPSYPASHGCVRVPTWESNHLDDLLEIGLPVHIWET